MKISKSKQELARIISENGGWRDGAEFSAQDGDGTGSIDFFKSKPRYCAESKYWRGEYDLEDRIGRTDVTIKGYHQTILSRDEYFHLHPAPDADGWVEWKSQFYGDMPVPEGTEVDIMVDGTVYHRYVAEVWKHWGTTTKYRLYKDPVSQAEPEPTIEQLAADYKAKLAIAQKAQEEADSHRCGAEAALEQLYQAGLLIGLDIAIAHDEPEEQEDEPLNITDWRDLRVGDVIELTAGERYNKTECTIVYVPGVGSRAKSAYDTDKQWWYLGGTQKSEWRFIRRP